MKAKLFAALYSLLFSLPHPRRRPKQQYPDQLIVLMLAWAALHHQSRLWACDKSNWPRDFHRPLPADSTLSRRARTCSVQQMLERAMARLSDLLDGPAGPPLVKAIDSKPMTVGAYSKDTDARRGRLAAGQMARGYRLHALCHGRHVRHFHIGLMHQHDAEQAPPLLRQLQGGGYLVADNAYDTNELHALAAVHNHQLVAPPRPCNRGVRDQAYNNIHRLRALDIMDSPLRGHRGPTAFGQALYDQREGAESCFGELSFLGLNYLPAWVRRPRKVALWVAAKILIFLLIRALKQGVMA